MVPQGAELVAAGQDVHAAVFYGGVVEGQPGGGDLFQRQPVEVGVVLVPGLFRADKGGLRQRHLGFEDGFFADELGDKAGDAGVAGQVDEGLVLPVIAAFEQPDGDFAEGGARGSDFVGGEDLFEGEIAEFMELGDVVVAEGIRANRACRLYLAHRFVAVGFNTLAL